MKSFAIKAFVLLTLLTFRVGDVYAKNNDKDKKDSKNKKPAAKQAEQQPQKQASQQAPKPAEQPVQKPVEVPTLFETVVVKSEPEDKLWFELKVSFYNLGTQDYSVFGYTVEDEHKHLFKDPYQLDAVKFHDKVLVFEDSSKLPPSNLTSLNIYTCKDNNPVLVLLQGPHGFTSFNLNSESGKWSNCKLNCLNKLGRCSSNGLTTYRKGLPEDYKEFFDDLSKQCKELTTRRPGEDFEVPDPLLDVYLLDDGSERRKLEKREVKAQPKRVDATGEEFKQKSLDLSSLQKPKKTEPVDDTPKVPEVPKALGETQGSRRKEEPEEEDDDVEEANAPEPQSEPAEQKSEEQEGLGESQPSAQPAPAPPAEQQSEQEPEQSQQPQANEDSGDN